ncbi:MAG: SPFH/Band 7/PHB domain protein [Chloroflexi bacterium]|nr:SPFH/Band 7/PHB domain protein [Chloroflexota bacterium]
MGELIGTGIVVLFVVIILILGIRIVPEYQRLVVFRLGRVLGAKGPGLVVLIPAVDQGVRVDLRERFVDVPPQSAITKDNAPVSVDFIIYLRIMQAVPSVLAVQDFLGAAEGIAKTTLRAIVGDMPLDDLLARRDQVNHMLRDKLDEVTDRWGVRVTAVEIREIVPPRDIQEAMSRQMSAERSRRATVTEAEGQREAAVTVAGGEKQAAILRAEGERQAIILRAQALALALGEVDSAAKAVAPNTMGLQYLDAFKTLGESASSKWIVPLEFTALLRPFLDQAANHAQSRDGGALPHRGSPDSSSEG